MSFGRLSAVILICSALCSLALVRLMDTGFSHDPLMAVVTGVLFLTWLGLLVLAFVRHGVRATVLLLALPLMMILPALTMIDAMSCSVNCGG